ncbi:hypothetical protein B5807_07006 [Epicoccum nigrum]|uniref:Uncharacterized protein n=1 Tax=Epicoccum nigrum TaxID=105696 RepID=A0A1Y2LXN4_EPING|nr:hypothetical protein B5807_07006 [Epicoccum nigrum]
MDRLLWLRLHVSSATRIHERRLQQADSYAMSITKEPHVSLDQSSMFLQGNPCHCYYRFPPGEGVSASASALLEAQDHMVRIIATALRESGLFSGRFFVCAIAASEMATAMGSARGRGRGAITQQQPQCTV